MRWWEVIRKHGIYTVLTGVTLDSWRRQVISDIKYAAAEDQNKAEALASSNKGGMNPQVLLKEDQEIKLNGMAKDTSESFSRARSKFNLVRNKLDNNKFEQGETAEMVKKDLAYRETEINNAKEIAENKSRSLVEYIQEIRKSDSSEWIFDLIDKYKHFVDSFEQDQKVAIINLIGYYALFNLSISVAIILGANHFIQLWNLDSKYPRLTKFLKFRAKVNSIYFKVYIILYIVIFFAYVGLNLYILFSR